MRRSGRVRRDPGRLNTSSDASWFEALGRRELRPGAFGLDAIRTILSRLGDPHERFGALHVAGTRGKGSTCALLDCALAAAGIRSGLTTSPHVVDPCERIRIAGENVRSERLLTLVGRVRAASAGLDPGYFEVVTAAAFVAFAEDAVDVAVVEVGLGGRLDATNVVRPLVTAITRLGLDHSDRLGTTRAEIAREKAGILKPGVAAVLAPNDPEAVAAVLARAQEVGARVRCLTEDDVRQAPATSLPGAIQAENAAVASAIIEELKGASGRSLIVGDAARDEGFLRARWPARLQLLTAAFARDPRVDLLLDVAHDVDSVAALCEHLGPRPAVAIVFSCLQAKDLDGMARCLAMSPATRASLAIVPELPSARARPASEVVAALAACGLAACRVDDVRAALRRAHREATRAATGPRPALVAAFGSFVLAGEVSRELARRMSP